MKTHYEYKTKGPRGQELVFESFIETEDDYTTEDILESIFSACNAGSRREDPKFLEARMPSLSVGDTVTINGKRTYRCECCGWSKQP